MGFICCLTGCTTYLTITLVSFIALSQATDPFGPKDWVAADNRLLPILFINTSQMSPAAAQTVIARSYFHMEGLVLGIKHLCILTLSYIPSSSCGL